MFLVFLQPKSLSTCQVNNDSGAGPVLCQRVLLDEDVKTVKEQIS